MSIWNVPGNLLTRWKAFLNDDIIIEEPDGRLVLLDEWSGYDSCLRPGCGHYRCEHEVALGKTIYVKPGFEEQAKRREKSFVPGCANAGCECRKFLDGDGLRDWASALTMAARTAKQELSGVRGVNFVVVAVGATIWVQTVMKDELDTEERRHAVYVKEQELYNKHLGMPFNFGVTARGHEEEA